MAPFFNTDIHQYYVDGFPCSIDDMQQGCLPTVVDDLNEPIHSKGLREDTTRNIVNDSVRGQLPSPAIVNGKVERAVSGVQTQEKELNRIPVIQPEMKDRMPGPFVNMKMFNEKTKPADVNMQVQSNDMINIPFSMVKTDLNYTIQSHFRNLDIDFYNDEQQILWNNEISIPVNMISLDTTDTMSSQLLNMDVTNGKKESVLANLQKDDLDNIIIPVIMNDPSDILRHRKELKKQQNREAQKRFRKKSTELSKNMKNEILRLQKEVERLTKENEIVNEIQKEVQNKAESIKKLETENKILHKQNVSLKALLMAPYSG